MLWLGCAAIAVAVIWILVKMYVSYNSSGGTVIVVVYDAAVYPPVIATIGLYFVLSTLEIQLALWMYVIIWAATTGVAAGLIRLMEEVGDRRL